MTNFKTRLLFLNAAICALVSVSSLCAQDYKVDAIAKNNFQWPEGKQVAVSLTFDDARLSQIDKGIPLLDRYNVKGTFYVSAGSVLKRLDGWKQAIKNGHEVGNHTMTHACTGNYDFSRNKALEGFTLEWMRADIDSANQFIKRTLGMDAVSFAYPCGQTFVGKGVDTKSYVPLIAATFESGRGWLGEGANVPLVCDLAQLTGMEIDGKTFDQVKAIIEAGRSAGKWIIFAGHEMDEGGRQITS